MRLFFCAIVISVLSLCQVKAIDVRLPDNEKVQEVLTDDAYKYSVSDLKKNEEKLHSAFDDFLEMLKRLFSSDDEKTDLSNTEYILKIILYSLFYALLGVAAFLLVLSFLGIKPSALFSRKRIVLDDQVTIIDEFSDISEETIDSIIKKEEQRGNYRNAVRLRFIKMLNLLSGNEIIVKKQNKTNYDYLQEFKDIHLKILFEQNIYYYDYIWYRGVEIEGAMYAVVLKTHNELAEKLNRAKA